MKTATSVAAVVWVLSMGLAACASGSVEDEPLVSGGGTTDAGSHVVIIGSEGGTAATSNTTGTTSSTGANGDDAGSIFGGSPGTGGSGDDAGSEFGDDAGSEGTCQGYAYPDTPASCNCSASDPSECQNNGCYGGYYCDTLTDKCKATAPSGC